MPIHDSILELVGNTPVVRARRLDTGPCKLYLKLESQNPGGSIKDRIGMSMIEAAEQRANSPRHPGEGTAANGIGPTWSPSSRLQPSGRYRKDEPGKKFHPGDGREVVLTAATCNGHPTITRTWPCHAMKRPAIFVNSSQCRQPGAHESVPTESSSRCATVGGRMPSCSLRQFGDDDGLPRMLRRALAASTGAGDPASRS